MSGFPCEDKTTHKPSWRVLVRNGNYSDFNGGRFTPSKYSSLQCGTCGAVWRTSAKYVQTIPDER